MIKYLYILILPILLNAQVVLNSPSSFVLDEPLIFTITANGQNIVFPEIRKIDNFSVQEIGTSNQTYIVNGKISTKIIKQYQLLPTSTIAIPSFDIKVDNKIEKTISKVVTLTKIKKTRSNKFDLQITTNIQDAYVGEEILFNMIFKYRKDTVLYDLKFTQPIFDNFWSKQLSAPRQRKDSKYIIQELNFLLFPQKSGTLEIKPLKIDATVEDNRQSNNYFRRASKLINIYSNSLKLNIKPLPKDIYLVGEFNINTTIDKTTIKAGEAVSLQLSITGRGNIDDLEEYTLNIPNATIYDNPSKKDYNIQNNKYGGSYKKSYSIVSQNDFTIPAITLKYFDKKTKTVKTVQSKSYDIKVIGTPIVAQTLETKEQTISPIIKEKIITKVVKADTQDKILYFILGVIFAVVVTSIFIFFRNRKSKVVESTLAQTIKKTKSVAELLRKLSPFINIDSKLDKIIYKLEENRNIEFKKYKKEILTTVKELNL